MSYTETRGMKPTKKKIILKPVWVKHIVKLTPPYIQIAWERKGSNNRVNKML